MTVRLSHFRRFYHTSYGRMVRRLIKGQILPATGQVKAAIGYAIPYIEADHDFLLMPAQLGAYPWPQDDEAHNRTALVNPLDWPLPGGSIDHLLVVHALEYVSEPDLLLEEATRVLRGQGHLTMIVTNRTSPWAEADWSPFGSGNPYSASQILELLARHNFLVERFTPALFIPPINWRPLWKLAALCERVGHFLWPTMAGVYVIEATRQLYSGITVPVRDRNPVRPLATVPAA